MHYRTLGNTRITTSVLGFGCMRLPTREQGDQFTFPHGPIDQEKAIHIIRKGIEAGINYIDTAYTYHEEEGEIIVGMALKDGYRKKVTLATKAPVRMDYFSKAEHFEKYLDDQLKRLGVDFIDIYLFHGINATLWEEKIKKFDLIERARRAQKEGKFKYLGFSFHDKPEVLKEIIDSNHFDMMLVQYNILDRANEEMIAYAAEKGLGVAVMGPNNGGKLAGEPPLEMQPWVTQGRTNFVDLSLKFVLSNQNVSVALSGMGSEKMVDDNVALVSDKNYDKLTDTENERIHLIEAKFKELSNTICTVCRYCMPCPNEVNIPLIFASVIRHQVYGNKKTATWAYANIGEVRWFPGKDATACLECGECESKCPQHIPIIDQLKEAHRILTQ